MGEEYQHGGLHLLVSPERDAQWFRRRFFVLAGEKWNLRLVFCSWRYEARRARNEEEFQRMRQRAESLEGRIIALEMDAPPMGPAPYQPRPVGDGEMKGVVCFVALLVLLRGLWRYRIWRAPPRVLGKAWSRLCAMAHHAGYDSDHRILPF